MKGAFEGPAGRTPSANRERVWKRLFSIRSSERFTARWVAFLESSEVTTTPVLFQHLTDLIFQAILMQYSNTSVPEAETPAVSSTEANALRYAAGYVCRHLRRKLEKGSHPLKEELIIYLAKLVRSEGDSSEESGTAEEWTELVDP